MKIDPALAALVVVLVVLLVSIHLGLARRQRKKFRKQKSGRELVEAELSAARRQLTKVEREQRFVTRFIREFPNLLEDLTTDLKVRQLPETLLQMMKRAFDPEAAMVLFRRRITAPEGQIVRPLVVIRTHPADGVVDSGTEIAMGQGELGLVAELQRTMSRDDFLSGSSATDRIVGKQGLSGFRVDLAAPMVFDEETVGVLAVSGITHHPSADKEVLGLIALVGAMTAFNVSAYSKMKSAADMDRLTKTLNKAAITRWLSEEIISAEKQGSKLSIFLFDIDNFKNYNDLNGHLAGDKLLTELAGLVKGCTRGDDALGRFGGEEFLLILPETDRVGARIAAEKVRNLIAKADFPSAEDQPLGCISISGGIATFPDHARDSAELLRLADAALYEAKAGGRNKVNQAETS